MKPAPCPWGKYHLLGQAKEALKRVAGATRED